MGCNMSNSRIQRPQKAEQPPPPIIPEEEPPEEELKDPEQYRRPSCGPFTDRDHGKEGNNQSECIDSHRASHKGPISRASGFDLHKDYLESIKHEIRKDNETPVESFSRNNESAFKITPEQHELIYNFVEEKTKVIQSDILKLHSNLIRYYKENEELPLLVETLKNNNKDVENCMDDLKAYPLLNSRYFYRTIEKNDQLIKDLTDEYRIYKRNIKPYKEFRDNALGLLRLHNLSHQDTGTSENTPELQNTAEKPKHSFMSKYQGNGRYVLEGTEGSMIEKNDSRYAGSTHAGWSDIHTMGKHGSNSKSRTSGLSDSQGKPISEKEEARIYHRLLDDMDRLKQDDNVLKSMYKAIQEEMRKNSNSKVHENQMRQKFLNECVIVKQKYEKIERETNDLQKRINQSSGTVSVKEYTVKLRGLNYQIQQRKGAIEKLEKTSNDPTSAILQDIKNESQRNNFSRSPVKSHTVPTKAHPMKSHTVHYGSPKLFLYDKPPKNAKIANRMGDNIEAYLDYSMDDIKNNNNSLSMPRIDIFSNRKRPIPLFTKNSYPSASKQEIANVI